MFYKQVFKHLLSANLVRAPLESVIRPSDADHFEWIWSKVFVQGRRLVTGPLTTADVHPFRCPHCQLSFRSRQGVSSHIRWNHIVPIKESLQDRPQDVIEEPLAAEPTAAAPIRPGAGIEEPLAAEPTAPEVQCARQQLSTLVDKTNFVFF